jgi:hypothetical protein
MSWASDADEGLNGATAGVTELWRRGLDAPAADAASRIEGKAKVPGDNKPRVSMGIPRISCSYTASRHATALIIMMCLYARNHIDAHYADQGTRCLRDE